MKSRRSRRLASTALALIALGSLVPKALAQSEAPQAKRLFSPAVEKKLAVVLEKISAIQRKALGKTLDTEITEIEKVTGLSASDAEPIQAACEKAIGESMGQTSVQFENSFRQGLPVADSQAMQVLTEVTSEISQLGSGANMYYTDQMIPDYLYPDETAAWKQALAKTFTPSQAAAWAKAMSDHAAAILKEAADRLGALQDATRVVYETAICQKTAFIKAALLLDKCTANRLDSLATAAVQKTMAEWRRRGEKVLLRMTPTERAQVMRRRRFYIRVAPGDAPDQQPLWKEGLATVLSPTQLQALETARAESDLRSATVLGKMMLAELDQKVAFTANQRQSLEPIATRLMKTSAPRPEADEQSGDIDQTVFWHAGSAATDHDLTPILDPLQCKHWKEACSQVSPPDDTPPAPEVEDPRSPPPEPEMVESQISDFLQKKSLPKRKGMIDDMVLRAEDIARAAKLPAPSTDRLQTAARGAAERSFVTCRINFEQALRNNLTSITPTNIRLRLSGIQDYIFESYYSGRNLEPPEKSSLWLTALNAELTKPQLDLWRKEIQARQQYRASAIALLILTEFGRKLCCSQEQLQKLEPFVIADLREFEPDIQSNFSGSPWYLQDYSMDIPISAIPKPALKAILTKEQYGQWTSSADFANSLSNWVGVQEQHDQRVKQ